MTDLKSFSYGVHFQADIEEMLGIKRLALWKQCKDGKFPSPGKLRNKNIWRKSAVEERHKKVLASSTDEGVSR